MVHFQNREEELSEELQVIYKIVQLMKVYVFLSSYKNRFIHDVYCELSVEELTRTLNLQALKHPVKKNF